jgi:hypothetical protein
MALLIEARSSSENRYTIFPIMFYYAAVCAPLRRDMRGLGKE